MGLIQVVEDTPCLAPSVYFSAGYGKADALNTGDRWITLSTEKGTWQVPLLLRALPSGEFDASTPYGYGGIYAADHLQTDEVKDYWESSLKLLRELGVVSVFFRFSPFREDTFPKAQTLEGLEANQIGSTFLVNVANLDEMWDRMAGRSRTAIRKARNAGFTTSVVRSTHGLSHEDHPFRRLYTSTMARLEARQEYFFSNSYFAFLEEELSDNLALAEVKDAEGNPVASSLLMMDSDGTVHYHLSASDPQGARLGANNLLIWSILEWAQAEGVTRLHLGGGIKHGDGLHKFKSSFGGSQVEFHVGKLIVDALKYDALTLDRAIELGCDVEELRKSKYFPAYRAQKGH